MTGWLLGLSCLLTTVAGPVDDPVFSGPQAGEPLRSFKALAFSGPGAGREVELPGEFAGKPTVLIFVHEITRPALQLIRPIDAYAAKWADSGLNARVVWLAADPSQAEQFLERARNSLNLKTPVVIALGGAEGPGNYGLNRNVTMTILVANDAKVVANFAIVQPNETDAPKVLAAMARLVGKPGPSLEEIKADSLAMRATAKPSKDPELQGFMRQLIGLQADPAQVEKAAEAMTRWAGDDPRRKSELAEYCKLVLGLGYGTEPAKLALKRLAGD